ncbi:hypothetical protein ACSNOI_07095 [Actinomadura kijaniata]|uniref:hypothetical protein n=1 Tax=Actinomadura kijaniata TaxID=46161 RepID=UPI003F1BB514
MAVAGVVALTAADRAAAPALPVVPPPEARVAPVVPGCLGYNGLDRHNPAPRSARAGSPSPAPRR